MRKLLVFLAVLFIMAQPLIAQNTTGVNWGRGPQYNARHWNYPNGVGNKWVARVEALLGANIPLGTGQIFYVDSGVTVEGDGKSWIGAKDTLAEALALCTSNRGDVVYVAQGHAESWAGAVTVSKAGVTIIGCGNGADLPTFTYTDTDGALTVTGASVTITGLRFKPGISAVVTAISLSATADNFTMYGCETVDPGTATFEFYDVVTLASGTDYCTIVGNKFVSTVTSTGCNQIIDADAGVVNRLVVVGNDFQGQFAVAAIHSSRACTNCIVTDNTIYQATSGQFAIEFTAAATGILARNTVYTDALTTAIDPGSLAPAENYCINTVDLSAVLVPPLPAIGTVTAGSADDILKKLYYTSDGTGAYPATAANDSTVAKIMAKGSTATASTYDNQTDSLEAISDAVRTAFPASSNPNYLAVTTGVFDTTGTWSTVASHEIATVTGLVKMVIIPVCTVSVSSASDTGTIALGDETTTNSIIAASTLGSGVMVANELWTDATLTRTILTQTQVNGTTVYVNEKDIGYTVATNALTGGTIVFHIWWIPLSATGAVVAGAGGTL